MPELLAMSVVARLVASIVDGLLVMSITPPIQLATGYLLMAATQKAPPVMLELFVNLTIIDSLLIFSEARRCFHDTPAAAVRDRRGCRLRSARQPCDRRIRCCVV